MNKELISLRSRSYEAEVVLRNFATRKRVHRDKPINFYRMYLEMSNRGLKLSRTKFDQVFIDLERLGYGIVEGQAFLPETSIKVIGLDAVEVLKPITVVQPMPVPPVKVGLTTTNMVMVVIVKGGEKLTVYVPKDEIDSFTAKMA